MEEMTSKKIHLENSKCSIELNYSDGDLESIEVVDGIPHIYFYELIDAIKEYEKRNKRVKKTHEAHAEISISTQSIKLYSNGTNKLF